MKAYVVSTGLLSILIFLAHIARLFDEGLGPLEQPVFLLSSAMSLAMGVWAVVIWRRL